MGSSISGSVFSLKLNARTWCHFQLITAGSTTSGRSSWRHIPTAQSQRSKICSIVSEMFLILSSGWLTQRSQSFFRYFPTVVLNCSQILAGIEPNLEFDANHKVWSTTFLCCPINPDRQLIIFYPFQTWSSRQMWRTATPTWRTSLTWQKFCRNSSVMVSLTLMLFKWPIPIRVTRWLVGIINFAKVGGKLCQTLNKFPKSFANFAKSGQTDWSFIYFTTH